MIQSVLPQLGFSFYRHHGIRADFSGGQITSDAGLLPLRAFDERHHLSHDWAALLRDGRQQDRVRCGNACIRLSQAILRLDGVPCDGSNPAWLDYPAMMKIPVSSPAVLGRLKGFCKPFDFVLAPILRSDKLDPEERAEKPILITQFNKHSDQWLDEIYYDVRTGKKCRISAEDRKKGCIPVKTYREILHQYLYHPECKFAGPDGNPCDP